MEISLENLYLDIGLKPVAINILYLLDPMGINLGNDNPCTLILHCKNRSHFYQYQLAIPPSQHSPYHLSEPLVLLAI